MSKDESIIDILLDRGIIQDLRNDMEDINDMYFAQLIMEAVRDAEEALNSFNGDEDF